MLKLRFPGGEHAEVDLTKKHYTIGRKPDNDIALQKETISGLHAELIKTDSGWTIVDLGSRNGTFVRKADAPGKREGVTGQTLLSAWDIVEFETLKAELVDSDSIRPTVIVQRPISGAPQNQQPRAGQSTGRNLGSLRITKGPEVGSTYLLNSEVVKIGRQTGNDFILKDPTVSKQHCQLTFNGRSWSVENFSVSNGTFVNKSRITEQRILKSGDSLKLGDVVLVLTTDYQVARPAEPGTGSADVSVSAPASSSSFSTSAQTVFATPSRLQTSKRLYAILGLLVVLAVVTTGYWYFFLNQGGGSCDTPLQGALKWQVKISQSGQVFSTSAMADINNDGNLDLITGDSSGELLALDGREGKKIFGVRLPGQIIGSVNTANLDNKPGKEVAVGNTTGLVIAYNFKGQEVWRSEQKKDLGGINNRPVFAHINKDDILDLVVPTKNKGLVALDGERGFLLWESPALFKGEVTSSPLVADVNGDGTTDFVAINQNTGKIVALVSVPENSSPQYIWESTLPPGTYASPALLRHKEGIYIVTSATDKLICLNGKNGKTVWQYEIKGEYFSSPLCFDANGDGENDVVAVTTPGYVSVLDGGTGEVYWDRKLKNGVQASPALYDFNMDGILDILMLDNQGNMLVLDGDKGRVIWEMKVPKADSFIASPVIGDLIPDKQGAMEVACVAKNGWISTIQLNRRIDKDTAVWPVFLGNDQHALPVAK